MATGDDIRRHLHASGRVVHEATTWLGLVIRLGERAFQKVRVDLDASRIIVRADVCGAGALAAEDALCRNAELDAGALALANGIYVLRHVLPLRHVALADVDRVVDAVAVEAARLRAHVGAGPELGYCLGYTE